MGVVIEELKQRIVAIAAMEWYQERVDRFRENRMFQDNQRHFYRELNQGGERCDDDQPMLKNRKSFGEAYGWSL